MPAKVLVVGGAGYIGSLCNAIMRAKGLRTGPIVFIPFMGAFIAVKDQFRDALIEAETAYGGPAAGALAATAIHILDVALWVAGSPDVLAVAGSTHKTFPLKRRETAPTPEARDAYDVEDIAAAHIRLSDGATLMLEGTWAHEREQSHYSFEMICEKGTLTLDPLSVLIDEEGKIVDRTPDEFKTAAATDGWSESVSEEIARFVTAIRAGHAPSQSPREIRNLQCIQDAIYASAQSGREVRFDV